MDIADLPAFSVLRVKMNFLAERQKVLAQNVANASTPGFVPKDLNKDGFNNALAAQLKVREEGGVAVARTSGKHFDMNAKARSFFNAAIARRASGPVGWDCIGAQTRSKRWAARLP